MRHQASLLLRALPEGTAMSAVTTHYGIKDPVQFLDVSIDRDTSMFVDPMAIRLADGPEPFRADAIRCMTTYFDKVTECVLNAHVPSKAAIGEQLLQQFKEPFETRLGYAADGYRGHGGAEDVGSWIWRVLTTDANALVRVGILTKIEEIPLFVNDIAHDITSDLTTRIIFEPLVDYTATQLARHPEFTRGANQTAYFSKQFWNPDTARWEYKQFELPIAGGQPLLLVPDAWARNSLLMNAGRFFDTTLLSHEQIRRAVVGHDGKLIKSRKDDLRADIERGRSTNIEVTLDAYHVDGTDLVTMHRDFIDERYGPVDPTVKARRMRA